MAEKENTLDWTDTDKSDNLLTPEAELMSEGHAQRSRLPTSAQHENLMAGRLQEIEPPLVQWLASALSISRGRGDTFSGYFADSSVQERFGDQRFSHQRENFSSPGFTKGQVPMDVEGASFLQGISHGPQWTNAMPSGGMRVNPWKVCTGTEDPRECNGHARESSRTVSGTNPLNNFAHNSNSAYARGNKKAATYDGLGSWQDYIVHFEMIAEINGWDENTKALELATCLRDSAQAILSDLRPDLRRSYAHLVAALTSRFQPSNQAELYRAQMKGKSRNKDQSLPEIAHDIKRVTRLAYSTAPIEVREQLARGCFIDSLNDADLE
ncbi:unnamed protein product [Mytilus coruscus]|uniref:Uncharacterized protein n=1 Tax=Mytilus coruscus TaxID=42192 RepID=A0A6J8AZJ7_MYTCO|nr:unnamed protein product [Mytilus coruscus]